MHGLGQPQKPGFQGFPRFSTFKMQDHLLVSSIMFFDMCSRVSIKQVCFCRESFCRGRSGPVNAFISAVDSPGLYSLTTQMDSLTLTRLWPCIRSKTIQEAIHGNCKINALSQTAWHHNNRWQTLAKDTKGNLSISSCVSSPLCPFSCPFRIRAAVTVGTPIPAGTNIRSMLALFLRHDRTTALELRHANTCCSFHSRPVRRMQAGSNAPRVEWESQDRTRALLHTHGSTAEY